jgi:thiol-disulfide isomerase/thioredoxin
MKYRFADFSVLLFVLMLLAATSSAQSSPALPGCGPLPNVRKTLDERLIAKKLEKYPFRIQAALRISVYEELIAKYPREVEPQQRLITDTREMYYELDPNRYPALQEKFRKQARENPDDPLALYEAGVALFRTDTPESIRLLEAAKAKAPQFPWPALQLAKEYSRGLHWDKQRSFENLAAFFKQCPDSTDASARSLLARSGDDALQSKVAGTLRAFLMKQADPARFEDYATLWGMEFRTRPPQEHDALRKQIAEDLKRLEALPPKIDSGWQSFLLNGYKQAGAPPATITAMEDRLLHDYPRSDEAYGIISDRWSKANKYPGDSKDAVAWAKWHEAYKQAVKGWIRDFPDNRELEHTDWFELISDEDSLTKDEGVAASKEYLLYKTEYRSPDPWTQFYVAEFLLNHKWEPNLALDLLADAKPNFDRDRAAQLANDNLSPEERNDLTEWLLSSDLTVAGSILKAAQMAGRPDQAKLVRHFSEGALPTQEKLQSDYWWNRARLAALDGHHQDALAYYQLALHTRMEAPQYSIGKLRDDLTREARELWKQAGGTETAWEVWSKPSVSKGAKLAQGAWEKAKKTLPAFELSDLSGETWRLKDIEGKAILINVWATWCGPCDAELPKLQKLYEQSKGRTDIQVLTLNIDEDLGLVAPYLKDRSYTFPVLPAYSLVNNFLEGDISIPQNWVVDPKGNWLWTQLGYGEEGDWVEAMKLKLESAKAGQ